jgi:hypothetical protein
MVEIKPKLSTPQGAKLPLKLPEFALRYTEVRTAVRGVWDEYKMLFPRPHETGSEANKNVHWEVEAHMWDKCKGKMLAAGAEAYRAVRKAEMAPLCNTKRMWEKRKRRCHRMGKNNPRAELWKEQERKAREAYFSLLTTIGRRKKDMAEAKAIKYRGKSNTHFLRPSFMSRKRTCITSMSVDGSDNEEAERTTDEKIWMSNFNNFYKELYTPKDIDEDVLKDILNKTDITLPPRLLSKLRRKAKLGEVERIIDTLPVGKAPGPDSLPYGVWGILRDTSPIIFCNLFNACMDRGKIVNSARKANIALLPKEPDSFACGMYRPISLTNTDYKIIMRIWANRLGPMLNSVVGGHQLGFIPGRDGRENVINEQFLIDYYQHKGLR